jgi:hypothetical protein
MRRIHRTTTLMPTSVVLRARVARSPATARGPAEREQPRQFYGSLRFLPTHPGGRPGTPPTMPVCGGGDLKPSTTYHDLEVDGSNPLPCS